MQLTLNITLLTKDIIFQSADHRLWDPERDELITDTSVKSVSLDHWSWTGFVTYTGIGRWGLDTSAWLTQWLSGEPDQSVEQTIDIIQRSGSEWLGRVRRSSGKNYPHTFVLAAFVDEQPTAILISNFEFTNRPRLEVPDSALHVSRVSTATPRAIVTGCLKSPVSRQQRRTLERLAQRHGNDPARVRQAMAVLNREAARTGGCPISEECAVQSVDRAGRGYASGLPAGAIPRTIIGGIDVGALTQEIAAEMFEGGPVRVVGSTFASSRSDVVRPDPCTPALSRLGNGERYELVPLEAATETEASGSARAAQGLACVIGERSEAGIGPAQPYVWRPEGGVALATYGGLTGQALSINAASTIVGHVEERDTRASIAVQWIEGEQLQRLPARGATHSGATHIADGGEVVGWVSFHPTEGGQIHFRPALWVPGEQVRHLENFGADWGQAVSQSGAGSILVSAHRGMRTWPVLWDGAGNLEPLAPPGSRLMTVGVTAAERVVAWMWEQPDRARSIVRSRGTAWQSLGTDVGWIATAVSPAGDVGGTVIIDGFSRPWVLSPGHHPQVLPHYEYHHSTVSWIGADGLVVGSATSDHGSHAVAWQPRVAAAP